MRKALILALSLSLASAASAALVTLTDGSSLSGEVKEQPDGGVIVVTGAGEISVAKSKIRSIVADSTTKAAPSEEGDMTYVNKVKARREKYGNEDGIPRTSLLALRQISFSIGQLNYTGDALGSRASDFISPYGGVSFVNSFNDLVGWELWAGYGVAEKDYGAPAGRVAVQRADGGFSIRLQKAILLGDQASQVHLIPHIGLGPAYSYVSSLAPSAFVGGSSVGMALTLGLDFQFGPALVGLKYRHLLSVDTTGTFAGRDTSASLPMLSVGWAF